ncbi:WecB/TagA/CpsF family glycosyltransferase [Planococcus shenhongbingii]|uniref:WecB/TagA/CpsF family glycosyltransferase n=1 Tax=Planococcus shenhongbingii TaxID=3058398 RepID=UPI002606AEB9|nr:WecB/TagA/CpsF family glycosyltransferase [Planococcus sp. N016]WKA57750.1 WecB/TagA/CpsF family glycosyltransferase [Planococcus sp. N016]
MGEKKSGYVLDAKISARTFNETLALISQWGQLKAQKYVCVCNTHSLVTGYHNAAFKTVLAHSDLCVPDGMPLVFALRRLGFRKQDRVDGPNLMLALCDEAAKKGYRIFLFGGTEKNLARLEKKLTMDFPGIQISGSLSPPFRDLAEQEEEEIRQYINSKKADFVFVSLGCPKQETWMYRNRESINGVMIGVGAAFDFIVGDIKRPPLFFQKIGLEWLFRLIAEPKRLFKRYAYNNPAFLIGYIKTFKKDKRNTFFTDSA